MKRRKFLLLASSLVLAALTSCRSLVAPSPPPSAPVLPVLLLIPQPKHVRLSGMPLRLTENTRLVVAPGAAPLERMAALSVRAELRDLGLPPGKPHGGGVEIIFGEPAHLQIARYLREANTAPCPEAEGYVLLAGPHRIVVAGHDPHGTFYGAQTLCQMLGRDAHGVYAHEGIINDYPSLSWRGAHLFVGDHALPFHEKLIARVLARLKMNALVLQCEQAKWTTLGKAAPPWAMSKTDLRADIGFARRYGLSVTPLVNSAGHLP